MKLLFRKTISSWTMTGLLGKGARWFLGLSILPDRGRVPPDAESTSLAKQLIVDTTRNLT